MKRLLALLLLLPLAASAQTLSRAAIPSVGGIQLTADYTNATAGFTNTALSINVVTGRKYALEVSLFLAESTAADGVKIDFAGGTATVTNFVGTCMLTNAVGAAVTQVAATTAALATVLSATATTDTAVHLYLCSANLEPATAGTLIVRAGQVAHTTGTLTVKRGSWLTYREL